MTTPAFTEVVVLIGAGSIGQAIARRIGVGKTILLADLNQNAAAAAKDSLESAGFETATAPVDVAVARVRQRPGRYRRRSRRRRSRRPHRRPVTRPRPRRRRSSPSTWSVSLTSSRSSAASSPWRIRRRHRQPGRPHASPAAGGAEPGAGQHPRRRTRPASVSRSPTWSPAPVRRTRWPNAPTSCGSRPPAFIGATAERGSTRSAPASS